MTDVGVLLGSDDRTSSRAAHGTQWVEVRPRRSLHPMAELVRKGPLRQAERTEIRRPPIWYQRWPSERFLPNRAPSSWGALVERPSYQ